MIDNNKELYEFLNGSIKLIATLVRDYTDTLVYLYRTERAENKQLQEELAKLNEDLRSLKGAQP